jgi:hypothetical protein
MAKNRQVARATTVHTNHVGLVREPVADTGDIAKQDRRSVGHLDGNAREFRHGAWAAVGENVVLARSDARRPGGEDHVGGL